MTDLYFIYLSCEKFKHKYVDSNGVAWYVNWAIAPSPSLFSYQYFSYIIKKYYLIDKKLLFLKTDVKVIAQID